MRNKLYTHEEIIKKIIPKGTTQVGINMHSWGASKEHGQVRVFTENAFSSTENKTVDTAMLLSVGAEIAADIHEEAPEVAFFRKDIVYKIGDLKYLKLLI